MSVQSSTGRHPVIQDVMTEDVSMVENISLRMMILVCVNVLMAGLDMTAHVSIKITNFRYYEICFKVSDVWLIH